MRGMDVIMAFPQIMLALVAVTVIGAHAWVIVAAIALTTAPRVARVTRGTAQPVVERDFVAATEASGRFARLGMLEPQSPMPSGRE